MYNDSYRRRFTTIPAAVSYGSVKACNLKNRIITPAHNHNDCEIFIVKHGEARLTIGSEEIILREKETAIVNPYEIHSVFAESDTLDYFCITFSLSLLTAVKQHPVTELCDKLLLCEVRLNNKSDNLEIFELMREIERLFSDKSHGWEFFISADIFRIFALLVSNDECLPTRSGRKNTFSRHVHEFIEERYSDRITSHDAATALSYDQSYFCRLFKSSFGKSFGDYLTFFRINKAKELLLSGMSVSETATKTGFDSTSYFTRVFKKHTSMLPSKYSEHYDNMQMQSAKTNHKL